MMLFHHIFAAPRPKRDEVSTGPPIGGDGKGKTLGPVAPVDRAIQWGGVMLACQAGFLQKLDIVCTVTANLNVPFRRSCRDVQRDALGRRHSSFSGYSPKSPARHRPAR